MCPSWKVHEIIGEVVCLGFHDKEIDKIIDMKGKHDAGRYDAEELENELKEVLIRWGPMGGIYYLLHHVLDRLSDILVSELCRACEMYVEGGISIEEAYFEVRESSRRRLRIEVEAFPKVSDKELEEGVERALDYILEVLESGWEMAVGFVILDTDSKGKPMVGERVLNGMIVKSVAKEFKYGEGIDENKVKEFLLLLGEEVSRRMKNLSKSEMLERMDSYKMEEELRAALSAFERFLGNL